MGYNKEKTAYLRGVVDGMELGDDKYGKLFKLIVETIDELAETVDENEEAITALDECIDDMCEELEDIDECIDALLEDDDYDDECDGDCDCCDDDECEFRDDGFVELECPHCGETVYFDADMLEEDRELLCPNCNQIVIPTVADDED